MYMHAQNCEALCYTAGTEAHFCTPALELILLASQNMFVLKFDPCCEHLGPTGRSCVAHVLTREGVPYAAPLIGTQGGAWSCGGVSSQPGQGMHQVRTVIKKYTKIYLFMHIWTKGKGGGQHSKIGKLRGKKYSEL